MATSSIIAGLTPKTEELKKDFLDYLSTAAEIALKDEPKTLRYSIALPWDEKAPDAKSIYVLEEYADGAGFDIHLKQQAVQNIIHHVEGGGLADEPLTLMLGVDLGMSFCRPDVASLSNPFVTVTELILEPGTGSDALRALASVFEAGKAESGTWGMSLYPQADNKDALRVIGIYESEQYWANVHCKGAEVQSFRDATRGNVKEQKIHLLKPISGFLYKSVS